MFLLFDFELSQCHCNKQSDDAILLFIETNKYKYTSYEADVYSLSFRIIKQMRGVLR